MSTCKKSWDSLCKIPNISDQSGHHVLFNNLSRSLFAITTDGLYKYSFTSNSWDKQNTINKMPVALVMLQPMAINNNTNTIYIVDKGTFMTILKVQDEAASKWTQIEHQHRIIQNMQGFIVNNQFHMVGGQRPNTQHIKYDSKSNKSEVLQSNWPNTYITGHRCVKVKDKVLLFEGCERDGHGNNKYQNEISEYDIITNQWTKISAKMPISACSFGCTAVLNDQFVLIFGGYGGLNVGHHNSIWIYSVKER